MKHRNLLTVVMITLIFATSVMAQLKLTEQWNLTDVKIFSGESALASGLGGSVSLMTDDSSQVLALDFTSIYSQAVYARKVTSFLTVGPTGGFMKNATWLAPIVFFRPTKFVTITTWAGIFFGKPEHPNWDINRAFNYNAIDFVFGRFGFGHSVLHFMDEKAMNMPYIKYSHPLGKGGNNFCISVTYNLRDGKPMFFMIFHRKF